jgi:hypothetical protein
MIWSSWKYEGELKGCIGVPGGEFFEVVIEEVV